MSKTHQKSKNKNRLREDDLTPEENADKALSGIGKSIIGEEKAEEAAGKQEMDLKVTADEMVSTPVEEKTFDLVNK